MAAQPYAIVISLCVYVFLAKGPINRGPFTIYPQGLTERELFE